MKHVISICLTLILVLASFVGCTAEAIPTAAVASSVTTPSAAGETTSPATPTETTDFPNGPITMIVPYDTGGTADVAGRLAAQYLGDILGQRIIVVNKPGGSGIIGTTELANSKADGYTIGNLSAGDLYLAYAADTFDVTSVDYLAQYICNPLALFSAPGSPYTDITTLVAAAKANPGKITVAESGKGHLIPLGIFCDMAGIELTTVSFNSGGESQSALLGGHVDIASLTPSYIANVEAGGGKSIGIYGNSKLESLPDAPYLMDYGYPVPNVVGSISLLALPNGVDESIRKIWMDAIEELVQNQDFLNALAESKYPFSYVSGDELRESIISNSEAAKEICAKLGILD